MAGTSLGHNGISLKIVEAIISSPALSKIINSDFIMELEIHVCLDNFQDTVAPPRINIYLLVDFAESAIQLASLYP